MADLPDPGTTSGPSGPRASFGDRLVAAVIDAVLVGVLTVVLRLSLGALGALLSLVGGLAYYGYLEGSPSGQTVGKRTMNIRVVDFATGGAIGVPRALIRYVARFVSSLPCGLGYFWMLWDPEKQTWHDKLATTVVVPTSAYPVSEWPG
ncbi:MAG: RDD family protein [Acidimicrobiia bacterium]